MPERLIEARWPVSAVLSDRRYTKFSDAQTLDLKPEQWKLMKDLVTCLKPLQVGIAREINTLNTTRIFKNKNSSFFHLQVIHIQVFFLYTDFCLLSLNRWRLPCCQLRPT